MRSFSLAAAILITLAFPVQAANIDILLTMTEPVKVTGTPTLPIDVGGTARQADYLTGSGSDKLTFRYAVQPGDFDPDGIDVTSPITLPAGATIVDSATNAAVTSFTGKSVSEAKVQTYKVAWVQTSIDSSNAATAQFTISGAPPTPVAYDYIISSTGGTVTQTGSGVTTGARTTQQVDVSNMPPGSLKVSVTLKLSKVVNSVTVSASGFAAEAVVPATGIYSLVWNQTAITSANAATASFTISGATANTGFDYTVSSSSLNSSANVTGSVTTDASGAVTSAVNLTTLAAGSLKLSIFARGGTTELKNATVSATGITSGSGILDTVNVAPVAAYSVRQLSAGYSGKLMTVRRSDGATKDIYPTISGDLDEQTLKNYCTGFTCSVATWYDQSGNGNNATQTTTASQPVIFLSGQVTKVNGRASVFSQSFTQFMLVSSGSILGASGSTLPENFINAVSRIDGNAGHAIISNDSPNLYGHAIGNKDQSNFHAMFNRGFYASTANSFPYSKLASVSAKFSTTTGNAAWVNSTPVWTTSTNDGGNGGATTGQVTLFDFQVNSRINVPIYISEIIVSKSSVTDSSRLAILASQTSYYAIQ